MILLEHLVVFHMYLLFIFCYVFLILYFYLCTKYRLASSSPEGWMWRSGAEAALVGDNSYKIHL